MDLEYAKKCSVYFDLRASLFLWICLLTPAPLCAAIIRVPQNFPTIQQAINAAANADTVLVAPGTYKENIDFGGKAITVKSKSVPADTIIDGSYQPPAVVTFKSGEGPNSVLQGFTIEHGPKTGANIGAILIEGSSPIISRNVITNNGDNACGIVVLESLLGLHSVPQILNNTISNNHAGGIHVRTGGSPTISGNIISGNYAGGILMEFFANAFISQNLIIGNGAGLSLSVDSSSLGQSGSTIVNNTIADNSTSGLSVYTLSATPIQLLNNVIVGKSGQTAVYCGGLSPTFRNNDVFIPSGTRYGGSCSDQTGLNGNISADPLFLDAANGLYYLGPGSPAIDAGDNLVPNLPISDLNGDPRILDGTGIGSAIIDMGTFETPPSPGTIEFTSSSFSAVQNSSDGMVSVIRNGGNVGQVTVDFATSNGTAQAGVDYIATSGTLTFLNGESVKTFSVPLINNSLKVGTETVNLSLGSVTGGATLGARDTAVFAISQAGSLQFSASSFSVIEGGVVGITITRTGGTMGAVSVNFVTSNGTATAGHDYTPVNQSITFADGEISPTEYLDVFTMPDCLADGNETIILTLSNPTGGAVLGNPATTVLTLIDKPTPRGMLDFDCDGRADVAIYRPGGIWFIRGSYNGQITAFGWGGGARDIPVPADYDGDRITDIAIYREGAWSIVRSSDAGNTLVAWGGAPQDIPVPGDYDGDGKTDIAIYRDGVWSILLSSDGGITRVGWGGASQDIPVPADYDGDGKTDIAIYRDGVWSILRSSDGGNTLVAWGGAPQDILVPADYDGDGKTDIAIYRDGVWSILKSSDGLQAVRWLIAIPPLPQDIPVPSYYQGNNTADLTIYRDGHWIGTFGQFDFPGLPQDILLYCP